MKKCLLASLCALTLVLSGCGKRYGPQWKSYNPTIPGQWQVNYDQVNVDSDTEFRWTIYVGTKSKMPNYTTWAADVTWKQISSDEAKIQLRDVWRLVPRGRFYFYVLSVPETAWNGPGNPATMVGAATSVQNSLDNQRLVKDIIYRTVTDVPILLASRPLQITSVTTDQDKQSITLTWKPLSRS